MAERWTRELESMTRAQLESLCASLIGGIQYLWSKDGNEASPEVILTCFRIDSRAD